MMGMTVAGAAVAVLAFVGTVSAGGGGSSTGLASEGMSSSMRSRSQRSRGKIRISRADQVFRMVHRSDWHALAFGERKDEVERHIANAEPANVYQKSSSGIKRFQGDRYIADASTVCFANNLSSLRERINSGAPQLSVHGVQPKWDPIREKYALMHNGQRCQDEGSAVVNLMLIRKTASSTLKEHLNGEDEIVYLWTHRDSKDCDCRYNNRDNRFVVDCHNKVSVYESSGNRGASSAAAARRGAVVTRSAGQATRPGPRFIEQDSEVGPTVRIDSNMDSSEDQITVDLTSASDAPESLGGVDSLADVGITSMASDGVEKTDVDINLSKEETEFAKATKKAMRAAKTSKSRTKGAGREVLRGHLKQIGVHDTVNLGPRGQYIQHVQHVPVVGAGQATHVIHHPMTTGPGGIVVSRQNGGTYNNELADTHAATLKELAGRKAAGTWEEDMRAEVNSDGSAKLRGGMFVHDTISENDICPRGHSCLPATGRDYSDSTSVSGSDYSESSAGSGSESYEGSMSESTGTGSEFEDGSASSEGSESADYTESMSEE